jgi:hypothetical protein
MVLLAPLMIYGLAALAVPVILHLWKHKKVVPVPFSTLRFLKAVASRSRRSASLEDFLLLLLRLLVVGAVAFAATRPTVPDNIANWFGADTPRTIAIVIDHSLSMSIKPGEQTRLDRAKEQAMTVVDQLSAGDEIMVLAAGRQCEAVVAQPTADHNLVRQAIQNILPTEDPTDLGPALQEVRQAFARSTLPGKEVYVFTDSQRTAWSFDQEALFNEAWKKLEARLVVVRPDDLTPGNALVAGVKIDVPYISPGNPVRGSAEVVNHGGSTYNDVLEVFIGDEKLATRPATIPPNTAQKIFFDFPAPLKLEGRWVQGRVQLSGDRLPLDDRACFAIPLTVPSRVLIVEMGKGPDKSRSGFFLKKALGVGEGSTFHALNPDTLADEPLNGYSAVILAAVPQIDDRSVVRLNQYLQAGGTVCIFPGQGFNEGSYNRIEWMPARAGKPVELPTGRQSVFVTEPNHPVFANSWDADTPFPALPQRMLLTWTLQPEARVLLTIGQTHPLILFREAGSGQVFIINASPDRTWGDFPLTTAFLPLVKQVARLSAARGGGSAIFRPGDPVPAPPTLPKDESLTLTLPDGSNQPVAANADILIDAAPAHGLYLVSSEKEGVLYTFAVYPNPLEGNPAAIEKPVSVEIPLLYELAGTEALQSWLEEQRGMTPFWPPLLMAALCLFFIETLWANISARRRAQGEEEHIATGRLNKRRRGQIFRAPGDHPGGKETGKQTAMAGESGEAHP